MSEVFVWGIWLKTALIQLVWAMISVSESALRLAQKLPSMAMLVVETLSVRSLCKTPTVQYRKVKSAAFWLCSGILFCIVVLFVLVYLDQSKVLEDPSLLVTFPYRIRNHDAVREKESMEEEEAGESALEGMGILFRKGTCAMPELVVAHISEMTTVEDLRLFVRGLHRSGMPARADVVLLFPWRLLPREFAAVIRVEEESFQRFLLAKTRGENLSLGKLSVFNLGVYMSLMPVSDYGKHEESMWGRIGNDSSTGKVHYGAVVGFDMQELDPDDVLSGFLDLPPAALRRWVCYQILLGMVRQRYRHVLLTEVTGVFILKDILSPLRKKDGRLHLYYTGQRWSEYEDINIPGASPEPSTTASIVESVYGKSFWSSLGDNDKALKVISTSVIVGGVRQIRSVAMAMATEIVRIALLRKDKVAFRADSPILSFLVLKSSVLGRKVESHLQIHETGSSIVNILPGPLHTVPFDDFFFRSDSHFYVLQGLRNKGVSEERRMKILDSLQKDICGSQNDIEIYTDCSFKPPLLGKIDSTKIVL